MSVDKSPKRKRRSASFTAGESEKNVKTPKSAKKAPPTTPKSMQKSFGKTSLTKKGKADSSLKKKSPKSKSLNNLTASEEKTTTSKKTKTLNPPAAETPEKEIKNVKKTKAPILQKESKPKVAKSPKKGKKTTEKNGIDEILEPLSTTPEGEWNFSEEDVEENNLKELEELESKYKVKIADVRTAVEGALKLTKDAPKFKKQVFNEQFPLFLQVNAIKFNPNYSKILRIPLANRLLTPDSDVCLIVADVKGIPNKEHDRHFEHYEKILRKANITNIKKIMTFHEFRTEYDTFELKNRLVELYDFFLVDGKISGKVVRKCGKIFYKKRKVPTAVKLQATKLKEHLEQTLNKTLMFLHSKGDSFTVQFGHSEMTVDNLVENVYSILAGLDKDFPGGLANVRNIGVYAHQSMVIPIYTTLKSPNEVRVPKGHKKHENYLEFNVKDADLL